MLQFAYHPQLRATCISIRHGRLPDFVREPDGLGDVFPSQLRI